MPQFSAVLVIYMYMTNNNTIYLIRMLAVEIFNALHTTIELGEIIRSQRLDFFLPRPVSKQLTTY